MSLRAALRQSLHDFYFNSWRLAPANLVWGAVLILVLLSSGPLTPCSASRSSSPWRFRPPAFTGWAR